MGVIISYTSDTAFVDTELDYHFIGHLIQATGFPLQDCLNCCHAILVTSKLTSVTAYLPSLLIKYSGKEERKVMR